MGAYGLAVAAAFAVALAVLLSVSSTQTAEAQTAAGATVQPGSTIQVRASGTAQNGVTIVRFEIQSASTADGSFASGDGQVVDCTDGAACDTKLTAGTPPTDTGGGEVSVALKVASDSPDGFILVKITDVLGANAPVTYQAFNVSSEDVVTSLSAKAVPGAAPADGTTGSAITVTVKNSKGAGVEGVDVRVVTTGGTLSSDQAKSGTTCATGDSTQSCTLTTRDDSTAGQLGTAVVTLTGADRPGDALLTFTVDSLTATATVTLYGAANKISVEAEQGSAEIGGSTNLVVTVTDSAGNPVSGWKPAQARVTVKAPSTTGQKVLAQVGYAKDAKDVAGTANDLPSCGENVNTTAADGGTNSNGKCVIKVFAGKKGADPDGPEITGDNAVTGSNPLEEQTADAERGSHSIAISLSASSSTKATATVNVSGAPASLTHDTPESVEPLSETKITVTVQDDMGVNAGATKVRVTKVDGGGILEGLGDDRTNTTVDGVTSFTLFAGGSDGTVTIVIDANPGSNQVREVITLNVASAMEEPEEPAMPSGDGSLSGSIGLAVFSGGSLDDLESAALAHCPDGAAIYVNDGEGGQILFTAGAAVSIVNNAVAAIYPDGLGANTAVLIARCEADAMENEGMENEG